MLRRARNSTIAGIAATSLVGCLAQFILVCDVVAQDYSEYSPVPLVMYSTQFHNGKWWKKENGKWEYWFNGEWHEYKKKVAIEKKTDLIRDHPKTVVIYRQPVIVYRQYTIREKQSKPTYQRKTFLQRIFNR